VDEWATLFNDPKAEDILEEWVRVLGPYYEEGSALRNQTLERLKTHFWAGVIEQTLQDFERNNSIATPNRTSAAPSPAPETAPILAPIVAPSPTAFGGIDGKPIAVMLPSMSPLPPPTTATTTTIR